MAKRRYVVVARVGEGSTGTVWRAKQPERDRLVAITELAADFEGAKERLKRIAREAEDSGAFDHPNLVAVHDYFEKDGKQWLVQEWVEGRPLDEVLASTGRLPPEQAVAVAVAVLQGLAHAHRHGLVHGDIRPANVLVSPDGTCKLAGFGLSANDRADAGGDVRATAALLSELLTGGRPQRDPPVAGRRLERLIQRARSDDPRSRPADATAFQVQLEEEARRRFGRDWQERAALAGLASAGEPEAGGPPDDGHGPGAGRPRQGPRHRKVAVLIGIILLILGTSVAVVAQRRGDRVERVATSGAPSNRAAPGAGPTPADIAGADLAGTFRITKKVLEASNLVGPAVGNLEATYVIASDCSVDPCRLRLQVRETGLEAPLQREGDEYKLSLRSSSDCVDPGTGEVQLKGGANATLALTLRPTAARREPTGWAATALTGASLFTVESASPGACEPSYGLERATLEGVRV